MAVPFFPKILLNFKFDKLTTADFILNGNSNWNLSSKPSPQGEGKDKPEF